MEPFKVGFNKAYAKQIGKDKFIKEFKDVYPDHDLAAVYDEIAPPKEKAKPEKEEK